ncbi:MAG: hypothetical protein HYY48_03055 [Gammaproteobacteria bacterium]|nr:hypothetical protein [Gammaproteobacteria bacterium]
MPGVKPVEPAAPGKKTSQILGPTGGEATVKMDLQDAKCYWNDAEFFQGDRISVNDECYECSFGRWVSVED